MKKKDTITDRLNRAFRRICVSFESCSTVVIPNYEFNLWNEAADVAVTSPWYTANTINIYVPKLTVYTPALEQKGYSHSSFSGTMASVPGTHASPKEVLVIQYTGLANARGLVEHIGGHFFGLPDTFSETGPAATPPPQHLGITHEFAARINCATNGDGFCDTEADPYPYGSNPTPLCGYDPRFKDGYGKFYSPPVDNYMSMWGCRCRFSQEQLNYMARYILKKKMHLH